MHGVNIASLVSTHSHKNTKVRNGSLVRQKKREEGARLFIQHSVSWCQALG